MRLLRSTQPLCDGTGATTNTFDFGDYKYNPVVRWIDVQPTTITIEDIPLSQGAFSERESLAGDYFCVFLTGTQCVEFVITAPDERTWVSYEFTIAWLFPTDPVFPNGTDPPGSTPGQIRVLQNPSGNMNDLFTIDMCLAFPVPGCQYFAGEFDPGHQQRDTDFSSQIVASTAAPIPEPATMLLVGSGLGAILYRRRRRDF